MFKNLNEFQRVDWAGLKEVQRFNQKPMEYQEEKKKIKLICTDLRIIWGCQGGPWENSRFGFWNKRFREVNTDDRCVADRFSSDRGKGYAHSS